MRRCFDCDSPIRLPVVCCDPCWSKRTERDGDNALRVLIRDLESAGVEATAKRKEPVTSSKGGLLWE